MKKRYDELHKIEVLDESERLEMAELGVELINLKVFGPGPLEMIRMLLNQTPETPLNKSRIGKIRDGLTQISLLRAKDTEQCASP